MDARTTSDRPRHLTDARHRPHAGQVCHLGLQRGAGFFECHALRGIKKVGIPHVGTRPSIRTLANGEMATPVLGMCRERAREVSSHGLFRM